MNDFKKGLLVGMLIVIGCGVFVANTSNDDVGRYTMYDDGTAIWMLDTKSGDLYVHGTNHNGEEWDKLKAIAN